MNILRLLPVIISYLLLAAHFYRAGLGPLAFVLVFMLVFLIIRSPWVARLMQVILVLGALEWVRTIFVLVGIRQVEGTDWLRMALILGGVALFTLMSAVIFQNSSLKKRYMLGNTM